MRDKLIIEIMVRCPSLLQCLLPLVLLMCSGSFGTPGTSFDLRTPEPE